MRMDSIQYEEDHCGQDLYLLKSHPSCVFAPYEKVGAKLQVFNFGWGWGGIGKK